MKNTIKKTMLIIMMFTMMVYTVYGINVELSTYDPLPAKSGEYVDVWFSIERVRGETNNKEAFIEVIPRDGLMLANGEEARRIINERGTEFNDLIVKYRLQVDENAIDGDNLIEAKIIIGNSESKSDFYINVENNEIELEVGDIDSIPLRIKPNDDDVRLEVTINNIGEGDATSVKAKLENLPEGVELTDSYSGTSLLGDIESSESIMATFNIDVDKFTKPGDYLADLKITYKRNNDLSDKLRELVLPLDISIKAVPLFEVKEIKTIPETLSAGDKQVKLTLTIENVGEEEAESARIKIYGKSEQPFEFDDASDYLSPKLLPGETAQATLEFDIEDTANLQQYMLDLEIKSIVGNDVIIFDESVSIEVENSKENNPWPYVMIGVVIFVLITGYQIFKHYKKKKKEVRAKKARHHYDKSYLDKLAEDKRKR